MHHATAPLTCSPLARRARLAFGALVVAAAAFMAVPAHAQFGGRASFAGAFQPDIMQRDLPLMVQTLGLEDWQRPVIETLLDDYVSNFNAGVEAAKERMKNASAEGAKAAPGNSDAILQKVMEQLSSWRTEKDRMLDKFVSDLRSQLGDQQMERWPVFERALRRERDLPDGDISGESVNLWSVLAHMQLGAAEQENIRPALQAYELALDVALATRARKMAELENELRDAMLTMDYERGAAVQDRIMALRVQVRAANDAGIDAIATALGARGDEFRRMALEAGYPDAYRKHPLFQLMDTVSKLDSLTPEQVQQVESLRAEFEVACRDMSGRFYEMLRAEEPKEPRRKVQAMLDRRAGETRSAPSTPQGANQGDPIVKLRVERDRMGEPYRERLMAILTPEQQAELPGAAKFEENKRLQKDPGAKAADSDVGAEKPEDPQDAKRRDDKRAASTGKRDGRQLSGAGKGTRDPGAAPLPNAEK